MIDRPKSPAEYYPNLDAIRAFACAAVMFHHLFPPGVIRDALPWGYFGVRLFFVLSGFLITGILLDARGRPGALKAFYIRRALRIFPIYYLVIAIIILTCFNYLSQGEAATFLTYTTNWYLCHAGESFAGTSHLWSLAVEEQFYLAWPWLILFLPQKWLLPVICLTIGLGPATRLMLVCAHFSVISITFNTFACLDTLGSGALLAWISRQPNGVLNAAKFARWSAFASIPFCILGLAQNWWPTHYVILFTTQDLFWAAVSITLVARAVLGDHSTVGRLLGGRTVAYLGKISYGLYLYHGFAPVVVPWAFKELGLAYPQVGYTRAALLVCISSVSAMISWHILESPINSIKKRFPYPALEKLQPATNQCLCEPNLENGPRAETSA